jgi:hypothetical protein
MLKKVRMYSTNNLFENTIFNNEKVVKQTECFEYAKILVPLNTNLDLTLIIWDKVFSIE